ncbi:MAG: MFS transporter, partial [Deltaproteobacteria bacterium]|nr:MFS transporter [Deltaproteobacteria bacterium]
MSKSIHEHHFKRTVAGVIGNVLEWYDFAVFGYFAPIIASQFFPEDDPVAGLINAFGVFAAGYLMRPLGGVVFGYIGDKLGRKRALGMSVMLMVIPTTLLGLLPTHAQVGIVAPIMLLILRLVQGFSVGGELIGSISYLTEVAPPGRRGFLGSFAFFGAVGGVLLGSF